MGLRKQTPVLGGANLCPHTCSPRRILAPGALGQYSHLDSHELLQEGFISEETTASRPRLSGQRPQRKVPLCQPSPTAWKCIWNVRPRKEQREFLVKTSAWRCYRVWFLLRHRVCTQPHTVRLRRLGCAHSCINTAGHRCRKDLQSRFTRGDSLVSTE